MILLDTNVLSEAMRVEPDGRVMRWLDRHPPSVLFLSAVTVDEMIFGIETLPAGRKRARLDRAFSKILDGFSERVVPFDCGGRRREREAPRRAHQDHVGLVAGSVLGFPPFAPRRWFSGAPFLDDQQVGVALDGHLVAHRGSEQHDLIGIQPRNHASDRGLEPFPIGGAWASGRVGPRPGPSSRWLPLAGVGDSLLCSSGSRIQTDIHGRSCGVSSVY